MNSLNYLINFWFPWITFFFEISVIQLLLLINFFIFFNSKNIFYSCVYFFFNILILGIFLSFFNFEFLTGFFWAVEFTVFFIFIVFFFYFSTNGTFFFNKNFTNSFYTFFIFFFIFFSSNWFFSFYDNKFLNFFFLWSDFFTAFNFNIMNDLNAFFLNFFIFNSFFFFLFVLAIFFTTVLCINLYINSKKNSLIGTKSFLKIFNFFKNFNSFSFLRKQNLTIQNLRKSVNRMVTKEQFTQKFLKEDDDVEK